MLCICSLTRSPTQVVLYGYLWTALGTNLADRLGTRRQTLILERIGMTSILQDVLVESTTRSHVYAIETISKYTSEISRNVLG